LLWLLVSEVSVHDQLALLILNHLKGNTSWWGIIGGANYSLPGVKGKEREKDTGVPQHPSRECR
jgi:hypothetical protein